MASKSRLLYAAVDDMTLSKSSIKSKRKDDWTINEINILEDCYKKSMKVTDIEKILKDRSYKSISMMASRLGITRSCNIWSQEEIEILTKYYPNIGSMVINKLPGRTKKSILIKAFRLGLYFSNDLYWSNDELSLLKDYYPKLGVRVIDKIKSRSIASIKKKVLELGIKCDFMTRWSEDETNILKSYYPIIGQNIIEKLPGRTISSISSKVKYLKIKRINQTN